MLAAFGTMLYRQGIVEISETSSKERNRASS